MKVKTIIVKQDGYNLYHDRFEKVIDSSEKSVNDFISDESIIVHSVQLTIESAEMNVYFVYTILYEPKDKKESGGAVHKKRLKKLKIKN